VKTKIAFASS